jgi:hypothetical protein
VFCKVKGHRQTAIAVLDNLVALSCFLPCSKHTLFVVSLLVATHIGMFVLMYLMLQQQNASVTGERVVTLHQRWLLRGLSNLCIPSLQT